MPQGVEVQVLSRAPKQLSGLFRSVCCFGAGELEPIGEKCQWHFAREPSRVELVQRMKVLGSRNVSKPLSRTSSNLLELGT